MCPLPRYHEPIEYDAERNTATIRGISFTLEPYTIEIRGGQARLWVNIFQASGYFKRKANGPQPKEEIADDEAE